MAQSPEEMARSMIDNLKDKTGKTLPQWLKIAKASGAQKHGELVKFLKGEHQVTHGYANLIAQQFLAKGKPASSGGDLVDAQYQGAKAELRPIYEAILAAAKKLGKDVEVSPKKSYVSFRRNKQFALVQPSTKTRVDVGIQLKAVPGIKTGGRLKTGKTSMISHNVAVTSKKEVDAELKKWLKMAYEAC